MYKLLLSVFLVVSIGLIALIVLQQNESNGIIAPSGRSASVTLFGSSGPFNFVARLTVGLSVLFFILSLALGNLSINYDQKVSKFPHSYNEQRKDEKVNPTPDLIKNDLPE